MAVSAATGLFGQLGRMGVTPQLAVREGNDQARTPVWKLSLLSADRITLKDGEDTDLWSARCKAPPDERGGNRYVRPTSTAPHLSLAFATEMVRCRDLSKWAITKLMHRNKIDRLFNHLVGAQEKPGRQDRC